VYTNSTIEAFVERGEGLEPPYTVLQTVS
jgi:hypothetical protein